MAGYFVPGTLADLQRLVDERAEESATLEFKSRLPDRGKNDDLAKDIAALANTDGGVILYGIAEDDAGGAAELAPFALSGEAERITQVAALIQEPIPGVNVKTIPSSEDARTGFLVVDVQPSPRKPHLVKGVVYQRSSKGNVALMTRRQVGELFARSEGFAQEFGLVVERPGRVIARAESEPAQTVGGIIRRNYYLDLENDRESDVYHVRWEWATETEGGGSLPRPLDDTCPVDTLHPGSRARIMMLISIGDTVNVTVRTRWRDGDGVEREAVWPLTW